MQTLERYLADHPDDVDALAVGVEWIYRLHEAETSARTATDDARLARSWADLYVKANGPQAATIKGWVDALPR